MHALRAGLPFCFLVAVAQTPCAFQFAVGVANKRVNFYVNTRPYLQLFLRTVAQWYDVVIFTASVQDYADCVINKIDPMGVVKARCVALLRFAPRRAVPSATHRLCEGDDWRRQLLSDRRCRESGKWPVPSGEWRRRCDWVLVYACMCAWSMPRGNICRFVCFLPSLFLHAPLRSPVWMWRRAVRCGCAPSPRPGSFGSRAGNSLATTSTSRSST